MNSKKTEHLNRWISAYLTEHPDARIEHLAPGSMNRRVNSEHPRLIIVDEATDFGIEQYEQAVRFLRLR